MSPNLKPQDLALALRLAAVGDAPWTQPGMADALHVNVSVVNHGLKRLVACQLFNTHKRRVMREPLLEFLIYGLCHVFPAQLGFFGRGMPTAFSAAPLLGKVRVGDDDGCVWEMPRGKVMARGRVVAPLYPNAPKAAAKDPLLYEYLALADTLRVGRARERAFARDELAKRLSS